MAAVLRDRLRFRTVCVGCCDAAIASSNPEPSESGVNTCRDSAPWRGIGLSSTAGQWAPARSATKGNLSMAGLLRVPRSRGALSGVVLVALGALAALIPFLGPWAYTPARLWLQIVPGVAAAAGGLILLGSANRAFAAIGAWLAALAGAWFIIGPMLSRLWVSSGFPQIGSPVGGRLGRAVGLIGFFTGLGLVIVFLPPSRWADSPSLRPETPSLRQPPPAAARAWF